MPPLLNHVQPGEIITSDLWNLAVDAINSLLQAGQTPGIHIASVVPAGSDAEPIRVASTVQITGQSFGFSLGTASVSFEAQFATVLVTQDQLMTGSSDTRLLFRMPTILGLPQTGATMTLRVSNGVASDTRSVRVVPFVIALQGDIFVNWRGDVTPNPNPNPIVISQPAVFAYQLQTGLNMPATFDLSVDVPQATVAVPNDLVNSMLIVDPRNPNQAMSRVDLGRTDTHPIQVRIPAIPATFDRQAFTLRVRASSGQVIGADEHRFTVGTAVVPPDTTIQLLPTGSGVFLPSSGAQDTTGTNGSLDGTSIRLRPPWQMVLFFNVTFGDAGTYGVTLQPDTSTTGWSPALVNTNAQYPNVAAGTNVPMSFSVTAAANSSPSGTVLFRVKRSDRDPDQSRQYTLQLLQA